jgi:hypothetical protein
MLSSDELQALILQVVVHDALIVPSHTYCPLLDLAHEALIALRGYSRDIAICVRVLPAQFVSVMRKDVL